MSAANTDVLPEGLQADRSLMRGLCGFPASATVREAGRRNAPAVRIGIAQVEQLLADGRSWIAGAHTSIADFAVYHALWFITARTDRLAHELAPYPRIGAWMTRMRGFGHGRPEPMSAPEALEIAAASTPRPVPPSQPFPEDPALGARVRIRADDYGRDAIDGARADKTKPAGGEASG